MTTPTPVDLIWEAHQDDGPQTALEAELYQAAKKLQSDLAAAQEALERKVAEYSLAMASLGNQLKEAQEARQAAEARAEQNEKDAERYRWLREHCDSMSVTPPLTVARVAGHGLEAWSGDDLTAAIDAAIAEGK